MDEWLNLKPARSARQVLGPVAGQNRPKVSDKCRCCSWIDVKLFGAQKSTNLVLKAESFFKTTSQKAHV